MAAITIIFARQRRCRGGGEATAEGWGRLSFEMVLLRREDAFQADKAKGVHASYQWELSGPSGGDWWLILNDGTYRLGGGRIHNPNVVASDEDWVAMSNKTLKVSWAHLTGVLKIQTRTGIENKWFALTGRAVTLKVETRGTRHTALKRHPHVALLVRISY